MYEISDTFRLVELTWLKYTSSATEQHKGRYNNLSSRLPDHINQNQWLEVTHASKVHCDAIKSVSGV